MRSECVHLCVHRPQKNAHLQGMALPGAQSHGPLAYGKCLQTRSAIRADSEGDVIGVRARVRAS